MELRTIVALFVLSTVCSAQGILRVPVVDADGEPVPGARVQLLHFADISLAGPHETLVRASVDADKNGLAKIRLLEGRTTVCLLAFRKDQAVFACDTPVSDVWEEGFCLRLRPARAVNGKLLGADGKRVEGARVRMIFPGSEEMHGIDAPIADDGSFAFPPLPNAILKQEIRLQAIGPGYALLDRTLTAAEIVDGVTLTLRPARSVSGRVVDAEGKPVEGAVVWFGSWMKREKATSAADGTFSLEGVPDGQVTVHVLPPRHVLASIPLEPGEGERKLGDVAVAEGKAVTGTVAEFDGATIEHAFVALENADGVRVRTADVGPDGRFELLGIGDGDHRLDCWIHAAENIGGTRTIEREFVRAGREPLKLVAEEGVRIQLLDRNKKPYPARDVRLTFGYGAGKTSSRPVTAESSSFHEIRFSPMRPGVVFDLQARTENGHEATARMIKADGAGRARVDLVFDADAPDAEEGTTGRIPGVLPGSVPPAKFDADADKDEVRRYVRKILESATEDRRSWSTSDEECTQLKMVGRAHVDVLIEALDHEQDTWTLWAIQALVDDSHKELVLKWLPDHHDLATCVVEHGWAKDAEQALVEGLRDNPMYVPPKWIEALASLRDREHHPLLLVYLERGANPLPTWKAIRDLPGLDAEASVASMWKHAKKREWSKQQAAEVAVEFGHVDALAVLVEMMQSGESWHRRAARVAVLTHTNQSGTSDEIARWFHQNRDKLIFDAEEKLYRVAAK